MQIVMSGRMLRFSVVTIVSLVVVTSRAEDPGRYLKLPECIASVVILPHIKQKINVWPNTDILVGVGFPIEITVTAPKRPFRPMPFPPPRPAQLMHLASSSVHPRNPMPEEVIDPMENSISPEDFGSKRYIRAAEPLIPSNIVQRLQLFKSISMSLSKMGVDTGEACIKRAICEAAMDPPARDEILAGELISVILRVPENDLPIMAEYNEAQKLGEVNRNCSKYFDCSMSIFSTGLIFGSGPNHSQE